MLEGWQKERSPEKRLLSMIFNKGPLEPIVRWAEKGLPKDAKDLNSWHPRTILFYWSATVDDWWITRKRITRREPGYQKFARAAREAKKPA